MRWLRLLYLLPVVFASACATNADLTKLETEQREMRALLADTQVNVENLRRQLDALKTRDAEQGPRGGGAAIAELKQRIAAIEARLAASATGAGTPDQSIPPPSPTAAQVGGTQAAAIAMRADERLLEGADPSFRAGLDLYRQGQWERAVARFREFIQANAKSDLADNAQYWIGESYFNQRDFNRAILELNEVLLKYPRGDRVPSALLALATAFADSGDKIDARLILQKLITDHPGSEEAAIGRQKLQALAD